MTVSLDYGTQLAFSAVAAYEASEVARYSIDDCALEIDIRKHHGEAGLLLSLGTQDSDWRYQEARQIVTEASTGTGSFEEDGKFKKCDNALEHVNTFALVGAIEEGKLDASQLASMLKDARDVRDNKDAPQEVHDAAVFAVDKAKELLAREFGVEIEDLPEIPEDGPFATAEQSE